MNKIYRKSAKRIKKSGRGCKIMFCKIIEMRYESSLSVEYIFDRKWIEFSDTIYISIYM